MSSVRVGDDFVPTRTEDTSFKSVRIWSPQQTSSPARQKARDAFLKQSAKVDPTNTLGQFATAQSLDAAQIHAMQFRERNRNMLQRLLKLHRATSNSASLPSYIEDGIATLITRKKPDDFVGVVQELRGLRSLLARARRGAQDTSEVEQSAVRTVFIPVLERECAGLERVLVRVKADRKAARARWEQEMKDKVRVYSGGGGKCVP